MSPQSRSASVHPAVRGRPTQPARRAAARKARLQVEALEDRRLLAVTTFAQFLQLDPIAQNFAYTNNGGTSATLNTVAGGDAILLVPNSSLAPALTGPQHAHLFLASSTTTPVEPPGPNNTLGEHFNLPSNTLTITLDTPVNGKTNFLTVTYSDSFVGSTGGHSATLKASDASNPPDFVHFSSDFIDFTNSNEHSFALSFTSVNSAGGGGLAVGAGNFFQSFTSSGTGTFDTDFPPAVISGHKFLDVNANHVQDAGEPGLANVTIQLQDPTSGAVLFSTTTDANGDFRFSDLPAGTYRVREVVPAGFVQTTPNPADVTLTAGSAVTGLTFGNFETISISGVKFQDTNGNGTRDAGEPGVAGVTIFLDTNGDGQFESTEPHTTTDANGNFSFTGLGPGTYRVREVTPAGTVQTTANPTDILASSGGNVSGVLFGNFQTIGISGVKFQDSNGNGTRDPGEPGLGGVTIFLDTNGDGRFQPGEPHTVTDASGNFSFTGLAPGTYRVREVVPNGFTQTTANPTDIVAMSGQNVTGLLFGNAPSGRIGATGGTTAPLIPVFGLTSPQAVNLPLISKVELFSSNMAAVEAGMVSTEASFVTGLYQNLLGRTPETAALGGWVQMLMSGLSRQQVAADIWRSPEHRGLEVDQFYQTYLGRPADAAGRAGWVNTFLGGSSEEAVILGFVTSSEFQAAHTGNAEYVTALYDDILGRDPDRAGLAGFLQALQSGVSRQAVAQALLTSPEADRRVVDEYYALFLNRPADAVGEQGWVNVLQSGTGTFESVGEAFLGSAEYFARFGHS